jgi:hypothetical protein
VAFFIGAAVCFSAVVIIDRMVLKKGNMKIHIVEKY